MPLAFKIKKKSDIPAGLESHYTEVDGEFVLDVDGVVPKDKLDEFRKTNSTILKALGIKDATNLKDIAEKLEKIKDIDPDLYARLKKESEEAETGKLKSKGDYEKALQIQRETMQTEFDKRDTAAKESAAALTARLQQVLIDDAVATAGAKKGIKATALPDLKARARALFRLDEKGEKIKAFEGDTEKFGKGGGSLTADEWIESLVKDAPHLFEASQGTHASGSSGGVAFDDTNNPYSAATMNLTLQGRLERENPDLAKRLKASAKR